MEINIEKVRVAYDSADNAGKKMIRELFPNFSELSPVTARIKTLYDACCELGFDHFLIQNAKQVELLKKYDVNLCAFAHLRIICAALNEGWVARPEDKGYYPGFEFFSRVEVKDINEEFPDDMYFIEPKFDTEFAAVCCTSIMTLVSENCLLLKTPELAKYCGKQFIDIWMDYLLPIKKDD